MGAVVSLMLVGDLCTVGSHRRLGCAAQNAGDLQAPLWIHRGGWIPLRSEGNSSQRRRTNGIPVDN